MVPLNLSSQSKLRAAGLSRDEGVSFGPLARAVVGGGEGVERGGHNAAAGGDERGGKADGWRDGLWALWGRAGKTREPGQIRAGAFPGTEMKAHLLTWGCKTDEEGMRAGENEVLLTRASKDRQE